MESLILELRRLRAGEVGRKINSRMAELRQVRTHSDSENLLFSELCFCILTANFTSEGGMHIQSALTGKFQTLSEAELANELRRLKHRFPNARAKYISKAQRLHGNLNSFLSSVADELVLREKIADEVVGLGFKEASHFMRNIGYCNVAILDFHIIDILSQKKIIRKPKTLNRKKYLQIEKKLAEIAQKAGLNQAELDFYLWYMETGKILK